jgi:hypothetical protein
VNHIVKILLVAALCISGSAFAHNYRADDGSHTSADKALVLNDITLSQVVYHDVTPDSAQLWLAIDGKAGDLFYFQAGVPYLDRLKDYRPVVALVGPGIVGDIKPPFALPEGTGSQIFACKTIIPEFFDEKFTGTQSWVLFENEQPLPADGRYYLVAYDPKGQPGKLWVTIGKREAFTFKDVLTLYQVQDKVRQFHEVADKPMPTFTFVLHTVSKIMRVVFFFV